MEEDESKVNGGVWKVAVGGENWEKTKKKKKYILLRRNIILISRIEK